MLCIACTGSTAVTAALPSAAGNAWESCRHSKAAGTAQLQAQHNCPPPTCTWEAATLLRAPPNPAARWDLSGPAAQQRRMQKSTGGESCKVERGTSPLQNRNPRDCKTRSASIGCGWRRKCFSFLLEKKKFPELQPSTVSWDRAGKGQRCWAWPACYAAWGREPGVRAEGLSSALRGPLCAILWSHRCSLCPQHGAQHRELGCQQAAAPCCFVGAAEL